MRKELFNSATVDRMLATSGRKWHTYPSDVIPVWLADPDLPIAPEIKKTLIEAVQNEDLFYGIDTKVKKAMTRKVKERNGIEITTDDIMITQGVLPSMWLAAKYAYQYGDEAIVTDPMYFPFFTALKATGIKPIYWKLRADEGYGFNVDVLNELLTARTKLLFICNPHNPCGRVMTREELKGIADIALDNDLIVMVDELWEDIIFDGRTHISLASLNPEIEKCTLTSWGFSKTYGVSGLQIGYLVTTNKDMMKKLKAFSRGVLRGTSTLALAVAPIMLNQTLEWWRVGIMEHLHRVRALVERRFKEMSAVTCPKIEGTYLIFPKFDCKMTSLELKDYILKKAKVAFLEGKVFGLRGENHLRMTIATSEAILNEVFDRIKAVL